MNRLPLCRLPHKPWNWQHSAWSLIVAASPVNAYRQAQYLTQIITRH